MEDKAIIGIENLRQKAKKLKVAHLYQAGSEDYIERARTHIGGGGLSATSPKDFFLSQLKRSIAII